MIKANFGNFSDKISKWETPLLSDNDTPDPQQEPDLATLRKQAFDQGYAEGLEKGTLQAQLETNRRLQTCDDLLNAMAKPFEDINHQALDTLAKLVGKIARCLVKRELRTDPETIMALVRDTVSILNSSAEKLTVHLHPEDALIIQRLARTDSEKNRWKVLDDPLLPRGDCRVSSRDSLVDGSVQSRINTIITQCQGDERA